MKVEERSQAKPMALPPSAIYPLLQSAAIITVKLKASWCRRGLRNAGKHDANVRDSTYGDPLFRHDATTFMHANRSTRKDHDSSYRTSKNGKKNYLVVDNVLVVKQYRNQNRHETGWQRTRRDDDTKIGTNLRVAIDRVRTILATLPNFLLTWPWTNTWVVHWKHKLCYFDFKINAKFLRDNEG